MGIGRPLEPIIEDSTGAWLMSYRGAMEKQDTLRAPTRSGPLHARQWLGKAGNILKQQQSGRRAQVQRETSVPKLPTCRLTTSVTPLQRAAIIVSMGPSPAATTAAPGCTAVCTAACRAASWEPSFIAHTRRGLDACTTPGLGAWASGA